MQVFSENMFYNLTGILIALIITIVAYFKFKFNYWNKHGLNSPQPTILFGNIKDMLTLKLSFGEQFEQFYKSFKSKGQRHGGIYLGPMPCYMPIDLEIIKNILQKDFQHFINRGLYVNEEIDPLSGHLVALEDTKWKTLRAKLTPTFTSGKIKMMFETMVDCTKGLIDVLDDNSANNAPVDIKDLLGRFTIDIIGSCAFGFECNCLKDPDTAFLFYGKRMFENTTWEALKMNIEFAIPFSVLKFINYKTTKPDVEEFFLKVINDTVQYREKNQIYRKDFMHLLLQLKNRGKLVDDEKIISENEANMGALTINELAAQCFVFFAAGFETSSTAMTFALFELSKNQNIQQKAREEINSILEKHNGKLTYDACMEMTYLEKVINETLRKYPPVSALFRDCTEEYKIPNSKITIEKGVAVVISVLGIHNDPQYYPNPDEFNPERFNEENKRKRPAFTWLPFGEGPRICIGLRFGMLQTKVGLITILKNYNITLSSKTRVPLMFDKKTFFISVKDGIWLNFRNIHEGNREQ